MILLPVVTHADTVVVWDNGFAGIRVEFEFGHKEFQGLGVRRRDPFWAMLASALFFWFCEECLLGDFYGGCKVRMATSVDFTVHACGHILYFGSALRRR